MEVQNLRNKWSELLAFATEVRFVNNFVTSLDLQIVSFLLLLVLCSSQTIFILFSDDVDIYNRDNRVARSLNPSSKGRG